MDNVKTSKVITITTIILLTVCLPWLLIEKQSNTSLNTKLDKAEFDYESLLSEKLLVEKSLVKNLQRVESLTTANVDLSETMERKTKMLSTQTAANIRIKKALDYAKKELKESNNLYKDLKEKIMFEEQEYLNLQKDLSDSILLITQENKFLRNELNNSISKSIDQTLVSAVKKNKKKVTSKARLTKRLIASVEVSGTLDDLNFVVEGPHGSVLPIDDGSITSRIMSDSKNITASANKATIVPNIQTKKIEISFKPNKKLEPGIYVIKIFNDDKYVGSMKAKLK